MVSSLEIQSIKAKQGLNVKGFYSIKAKSECEKGFIQSKQRVNVKGFYSIKAKSECERVLSASLFFSH